MGLLDLVVGGRYITLETGLRSEESGLQMQLDGGDGDACSKIMAEEATQEKCSSPQNTQLQSSII